MPAGSYQAGQRCRPAGEPAPDVVMSRRLEQRPWWPRSYPLSALAVSLGEDELLDREPRQPSREVAGRVAGDDVAGGGDVAREPEELADRCLLLAEQRRQRGGDALVAQREQQVLHHRVHGGAGDEVQRAAGVEALRVHVGMASTGDEDGRSLV